MKAFMNAADRRVIYRLSLLHAKKCLVYPLDTFLLRLDYNKDTVSKPPQIAWTRDCMLESEFTNSISVSANSDAVM